MSNFPEKNLDDEDLHIKHSLCQTDSPRPLFPKIIINRELNLLERVQPLPSDVTDEDNSENEDFVMDRTYMFSQLLKDLDELCELQTPYLEQQIEEISENLSVSNGEEEEEETDLEQDLVGISFLRTNDYPWNKKDEVAVEPIQQSEDETESESETVTPSEEIR